MKKLLLISLLTLLNIWGGVNLSAEVKTIEITPKSLNSTSGSYIENNITFSIGETSFTANQINPSTGQIKVKNAGTGGFVLYNTTAIPNIQKVELITKSATGGTWVVGVGETEIKTPVSASAANSVAVSGTATSTVFDVSKIDVNRQFFHLSLSAKGSNAQYLVKIVITYDEGPQLSSPELRFDREVRYGKLGVGVVWEAAKQIGDGVITYTSSDPETVAVNEATGQILPEDVKKAGSVTITASVPATENYRAETADYTVVVQDPSEVPANRVTFDFTTKDPYGMTTRTDNQYDTADRTITEGNVSITMKGKHRSYGASSHDLRFGQNGSFTISVPNNDETKGSIEKITINTTKDWDVDKGNISISTEGTGLREWIPNGEKISEVTFTNTASSAKPLQSITVIWKDEKSNMQIANLSFDKTVYNTTVGVETEINKVNNPNGVDAKYSIDCLNDGEYTLNEVDGKLSITINKVGVYTLRAHSDATDSYLPGMAILRLNVFPVLDVKVGDEIAEIENEAIKLPEEGGVISFGEVPVTVDIYYKSSNEDTPMPTAGGDVAGTEGYTLYEGNGIQFTKPGKLEYFMRYSNAYNSPVYALDVHVGNQTTGIDEIGVDDSNAAVEYFNLQGVRVENPAVGGLYIRRQGNTVTKVIVK